MLTSSGICEADRADKGGSEGAEGATERSETDPAGTGWRARGIEAGCNGKSCCSPQK